MLWFHSVQARSTFLPSLTKYASLLPVTVLRTRRPPFLMVLLTFSTVTCVPRGPKIVMVLPGSDRMSMWISHPTGTSPE